ncbi:Hint domain-containing protein [Neokomagataea anthophila]|uniref:Hint domain-containing protein n=1 Tax=Neokomagataea anthophila TaxID=2826925 RepID=A0ABS5E7E8_9PROT|nr:Hint domain-containing protein [Neokomagataea anthophila]MBR0559824.1 Hint domain-containing protein [Neokomagataea anthophila]
MSDNSKYGTGDIVSYGHTKTLNINGQSTGDVIEAGGYENAEAELPYYDNGVVNVYDATITGEDSQLAIGTGAKAHGVIVDNKGLLYVGHQSFAEDIAVKSGGTIEVDFGKEYYSGAKIENLTISSGGTLTMYPTSDPDDQAPDIENVDLEPGAIIREGFTNISVGDGKVFFATYYGQVFSSTLSSNKSNIKIVQNEDAWIVEEGTPCYCRGTLIRTAGGDVPVEHLQIGDQLHTQSNGLRAIRWIGRRSYSGQFASGNRDVLPVTFRRGALGGGLPTQDLSVSPLHAMFLDGALIPAVMLVNGRSIVQAEGMDEVAYFHIELESHDVIFANDAPSETFIDDDSRGMFHNAHEYKALYPEVEAGLPHYCAPRLEEGAELQVIRDRLVALCDGSVVSVIDVEGFVDVVTRDTVAGWARSLDHAEAVTLDVIINGHVVGQVTANQPRADVGGDVGFTFVLPQALAAHERHVIEVRRVQSGAALGHSPWVLDQLERHDALDQAKTVVAGGMRSAAA